MITERSTEPAVGYRQWWWDGHDLHGFHFPGSWSAGPNRARCVVRGFAAKVVSRGHDSMQYCRCGLHAKHELTEDLLLPSVLPEWRYWAMFGHNNGYTPMVGITGAVKGWGEVIIHPQHWRAEQAEIVALLDTPSGRQAAASYGVPVLPAKLLPAQATEHGMGYAPL